MPPTKLLRCLNPLCADERGQPHGFVSPEPKCPKCGIEAKHPRFGGMIQRLAKIHFDPPAGVPGFGCGHRACETTRTIAAQADAAGNPEPFHGGTGDPDAVTCPECRETEAWKQAHEAVHEGGQAAMVMRGALLRLEHYREPAPPAPAGN